MAIVELGSTQPYIHCDCGIYSHTYTVTVVSTAVDHCHGQDIDAWRCYDMETLSTKLALCEGNPPVTGGFQSQKASDVEF